jgi:1-phosphofructokinase
VTETTGTATPVDSGGHVVVFGPNPVLEVSIEPSPNTGPRIRVMPGGQPVWVSRMARTLGSTVTLCGLAGGEVGSLLVPMLEQQPFECRLVVTRASSGSFVVDQRHEPATEIASSWASPPTAAEVDELLRVTLDAARRADVMVVCNPMPGDALPLSAYTTVVSEAAGRGVPVVVDLSSPRLDAALRGGPAVVKLNDWELAELVTAPVDEPEQRTTAVDGLIQMGARSVVVTRGPSTVYSVDEAGTSVELLPPRLGPGRAAGCGDAMTGALAAALAQGTGWLDAVVVGMAAGAAHYSGRGETSRAVIETLAAEVSRRSVPM